MVLFAEAQLISPMLPSFTVYIFFAPSLHVNAFEPVCPIIFDGRVPPNAKLTAFDTTQAPFSELRGRPVKWSLILVFLSVRPPVFHYEFGGKPLEIQINENSVFPPSGTEAQSGYRRANVIFAGNTGSDPSTSGVVTYHWSLRQSKDQPLNLIHEYVALFHERKTARDIFFSCSQDQ
jgi:hypothetical protein